MTKSEKEVETIRGDGLWLTMDSNKKILEIIGDGCKLTLAKNYGRIRIIGDGCRLKVIENLGFIEYKGDGGRVDLGPDSDKDKVTFYGHGGHVKFLDEKPGSKRGNVKRENEKEVISSNLKENFKQKKNSDFDYDNRENEKRERRRKKEAKTERGSTITVTKIVCANGECKTSVRTFHKEVDPIRS